MARPGRESRPSQIPAEVVAPKTEVTSGGIGQQANDPAYWERLTKEYTQLTPDQVFEPSPETNGLKVSYVASDGGGEYPAGVDMGDGELAQLIATKDGKVVASLEFGSHSSDEPGMLEAGSVSVHPDFRRQGVATSLYKLAERITGHKFAPSQLQSPDGMAMWDSGKLRNGILGKLTQDTAPEVVAYHGTDDVFSAFDDAFTGKRTDPGFFGRGVYLVDDAGNAQRWGKHVVTAKVKLKNPLFVDGMSDWIAKSGQQKTEGKAAYAKEIARVTEKLKARGYDGVVITRSDGVKQYVVFDSSKLEVISHSGQPPAPTDKK